MRSRARSPASNLSEDSQYDEQTLSRIGQSILPSRKIIDQWGYTIAASMSNLPYTSERSMVVLQHKPQEHPKKAIPETKRSSTTFGFHSPTWGLPTVNCRTEQRTRKLLETDVPHIGYTHVQPGNFSTGRRHSNNFETWVNASNVWATIKRVLRSSSVATRQSTNY